MRVEVTFDVPAELTEDAARAAAAAALAHGGRSGGQLDVVLVSDEALAELHERFLQDGSVTDVMSFDLSDEDGEQLEVYVSVDRAREVAAARGLPVERELALYIVHGTLHLCGHDDHDDEDRARMRLAEQCVMDALGYPRDDAPHEFVGD